LSRNSWDTNRQTVQRAAAAALGIQVSRPSLVHVQKTWLNTYMGLAMPLMASATATFLFRQFYQTLPNELA
jgi:ABC-type glycerol-3-phosphate transport system permease component